MAENRLRGKGKPFQKGVAPNPGGRPKMAEFVRDLLHPATQPAARRLIDALDATKNVIVGGAGLSKIYEEVPDHQIRITAAQIIIERMAGKPVQEISGVDGGAIELNDKSGLLVLALLKRLTGEAEDDTK